MHDLHAPANADTGHSVSTDDRCAFETMTTSHEQTQLIGERLGELVRAGDLILLTGNLGAGKTTFTQGIARGMQIEEVVNSPTFTLLKEYTRPANIDRVVQHGTDDARALYHFDLYRLEEPEEIVDLGFEDYFAGDGVSVVEWAERNDGNWPDERLEIFLTLSNEVQRHVLFKATGARYCEMVQQLQKNWQCYY